LLNASDQGVARYSDGDLTVYDGTAGEVITALAASPSGEIWAATALAELLVFNGVTWTPAPTEQLPSRQINALIFDAEGALWIGTAQGGLARYTP
jgi:ligand-binding sensor domain-containing protein